MKVSQTQYPTVTKTLILFLFTDHQQSRETKKDEMNVVSRFLECQLCLLVEGDPSTTEVEKIIAENSNTKRK